MKGDKFHVNLLSHCDMELLYVRHRYTYIILIIIIIVFNFNSLILTLNYLLISL